MITYIASIYVAIFTNRLTANLPADIVPAVEKAGLPASSVLPLFGAIKNGTAAALEAVPGINAKIIAALGTATQDAYASSFKTVYLSSLSFGAVSIIASFFMTDIKHFLTDFVNKAIHDPRKGNDDAV